MPRTKEREWPMLTLATAYAVAAAILAGCTMGELVSNACDTVVRVILRAGILL